MQVKEILDTMQTRMLEANKEGRNNIEFPVPKQFVQFPNDADSELLVIATVLRELKAQDYKVEILDIKHSMLFDIRWIADISDAEREKMKQLLREHMVRREPQKPSKEQMAAMQYGKNNSAALMRGAKSKPEPEREDTDDSSQEDE